LLLGFLELLLDNAQASMLSNHRPFDGVLTSTTLQKGLRAFVQVRLFVGGEYRSQDLKAAAVRTDSLFVQTFSRMRVQEFRELHFLQTRRGRTFDDRGVNCLLSILVEVTEPMGLVFAFGIHALASVGQSETTEVLLARLAGAALGQQSITGEAEEIRVKARGVEASKALDL